MKRKKYLLIGIILIIFLIGLYLITSRSFKFNSPSERHLVELTETIDPDIVLVNLEEGDRPFIGSLILKIDSCKPYLIGIDGWFNEKKDSTKDSILMNAFENIQNDVIGYFIDSSGIALKSDSQFGSLVKEQGALNAGGPEGQSSSFIPIQNINKERHKHFSLKIIELWKPNFKSNFREDEVIPIKFTRTLNQFIHFNGSQLTANNCEVLKNKIVLLGYLGPKEEDKHFTPLRTFGRFDADEPDTYGLVIIANEIRTILEYEK